MSKFEFSFRKKKILFVSPFTTKARRYRKKLFLLFFSPLQIKFTSQVTGLFGTIQIMRATFLTLPLSLCHFVTLVLTFDNRPKCKNRAKMETMSCSQGRINHKADQAKCLEPTKKKGPTKTKNEGVEDIKGQNEGKRSEKKFCFEKNCCIMNKIFHVLQIIILPTLDQLFLLINLIMIRS